ncbi:hypothetical protein [Paucibacter sp. PLA-PC-4]|uniref:hypothetical protein n=1 Tax=Paucibacter sp. PLA-PC-4 TaxID=2993655 RepID=UPI002B057661|nr:hypothetical protein [Paucibacter sp. PLA-PC-4]
MPRKTSKKAASAKDIEQMVGIDSAAVLERQLLLQLGHWLKRLRKALGLGTVEMAGAWASRAPP